MNEPRNEARCGEFEFGFMFCNPLRRLTGEPGEVGRDGGEEEAVGEEEKARVGGEEEAVGEEEKVKVRVAEEG